MALPLLAGAVATRLGGGIGRRLLRRGRRAVAAGAGVVARVAGPAVAARLPGIAGVRRRRRIPALSSSEMGKLLFLGQVLGRRSPAMTLIVMRALGGRV